MLLFSFSKCLYFFFYFFYYFYFSFFCFSNVFDFFLASQNFLIFFLSLRFKLFKDFLEFLLSLGCCKEKFGQLFDFDCRVLSAQQQNCRKKCNTENESLDVIALFFVGSSVVYLLLGLQKIHTHKYMDGSKEAEMRMKSMKVKLHYKQNRIRYYNKPYSKIIRKVR